MQTTEDPSRGPGAKSNWSQNTPSFWTFNGSCKFACFL